MATATNIKTLERKRKALLPDYRAYCKAQAARAQVTSATAVRKYQRVMDSLRPQYTEFRRLDAQLRKARTARTA